MHSDSPPHVDTPSESDQAGTEDGDGRRFAFSDPPQNDQSSDGPSTIVNRSDMTVLREGLSTTWKILYRYSAELIVVSVVWFLASLPLLTIGPATVWAYATVDGLIDDHRFEPRRSLHVVRRRFIATTVLGWFPLLFGAGTIAFFLEFAHLGSSWSVTLAVASAYAVAFSSLLLIPTFVGLSQGTKTVSALKRGYLWTVLHPTLALTTAVVTFSIFVVTAVLTVGFALLFAGIAFTFHRTVVTPYL